jgi:hypothetical protein
MREAYPNANASQRHKTAQQQQWSMHDHQRLTDSPTRHQPGPEQDGDLHAPAL